MTGIHDNRSNPDSLEWSSLSSPYVHEHYPVDTDLDAIAIVVDCTSPRLDRSSPHPKVWKACKRHVLKGFGSFHVVWYDTFTSGGTIALYMCTIVYKLDLRHA